MMIDVQPKPLAGKKGQRWPGSFGRDSASDKWIACRFRCAVPFAVLAQGGRSPTGARTANGGRLHAATNCGRPSK